MESKIATQMMIEHHATRSRLGHPPSHVKTDEDYCRWALSEIERQARADAEPFIARLVEIESRKPIQPILIPIGDWPAHLPVPLAGKSN